MGLSIVFELFFVSNEEEAVESACFGPSSVVGVVLVVVSSSLFNISSST